MTCDHFSINSPERQSHLIQEALTLRSWGWSVFPLRAKVPRVGWKRWQSRLPSDKQVQEMCSLSGVDGFAIVTGPVSGGLMVRDFDTVESYHAWAGHHPRLAKDIPTVKTRRGFHVYARSKEPVFVKMADGELRGDSKHIVVAPPSAHPKGGNYSWLNGPPSLSDFPLLDPMAAGFVPTITPPTLPKRDKRSKQSLAVMPPASNEPLPPNLSECVLRSLPRQGGERNASVYRLVRSLRSCLPDDAPHALLERVFCEWWKKSHHIVETQDFALTINDFWRGWASNRVSMSESRPMVAMSNAVLGKETPRERLKAACRALAETTGGNFHLSARKAGEVAGVSHDTGARFLKEMVGSGELVLVTPGVVSATKRIATFYRLGI